jgi:endonuclease/exonuclease/phosphatase family metal-dependent hydrolase
MRIVSYNILDGGEGRADPLAEVVIAQRPDIVALVEADNVVVLERLATRLKMDFIQAQGDAHAVALLSRWTISETINRDGFLEAKILSPDGLEWIVAVTQPRVPVGAVEFREHLLVGEFAAGTDAPQGYVEASPSGGGGTYSTQNPAELRDRIFMRGIDRSRVKEVWIERDRLAKYASDHFPIGAEMV